MVVLKMKWEEVGKIYPNRFVKIKIIDSKIEGNKRYITDMAVIEAYYDNEEATKELVRAKASILNNLKRRWITTG